MSAQQLVPLIGSVISIGGIIFKMGQHAERMDVLDITVHAQEKKSRYKSYNHKSDI